MKFPLNRDLADGIVNFGSKETSRNITIRFHQPILKNGKQNILLWQPIENRSVDVNSREETANFNEIQVDRTPVEINSP